MVALSLSGLPTEILLEVKTNLSYASRVALRLTCRELYHKVDNANRRIHGTTPGASNLSGPTLRNYSMKDLLEIEMWPEYNSAQYRPAESKQPIRQLDFFACHLCFRIRCASKFSNAMMKGKRGKLGDGTVTNKVGRFCIPCGLSVGIYKRGDYLQYGGAGGGCAFICHKCNTFNPVEFAYVPPNGRFCATCS